jgi:hypothetical protein
MRWFIERISKSMIVILTLPVVIIVWFIIGVFLLTLPIFVFFFPSLIEFSK